MWVYYTYGTPSLWEIEMSTFDKIVDVANEYEAITGDKVHSLHLVRDEKNDKIVKIIVLNDGKPVLLDMNPEVPDAKEN